MNSSWTPDDDDAEQSSASLRENTSGGEGETPSDGQPDPLRSVTGDESNEPPGSVDANAGDDATAIALAEKAEVEAQMNKLRQQLGETPAALVVANHCFGLFELAALHLAHTPPRLTEAQLAIDALGALVENLTGRLGENENQLRDGLAQLRLAFVQIRKGLSEKTNTPN